jgi:hypothetical protein
MGPSWAARAAIAGAYWLANYEINRELRAPAFAFLSVIGVCVDRTLRLCLVSVFALPATVLAALIFTVALLLARSAFVRKWAAPVAVASTCFWAGLGFVLGAVLEGVVAARAPGRVGDSPGLDALLRAVGPWFPVLFAALIVLGRAFVERAPAAMIGGRGGDERG